MHRGRGVALPRDDVAGADFQPPAIVGQPVGVFGAAQGIGQPGAQRFLVAAGGAMGVDDALFARLQRPVQIGHDEDVVGNKSRGAKRSFQFAAQIDQYDPGAA